MKAKEYLKQIKILHNQLNQKKQELQDLKDSIADVSATVIDDMPKTFSAKSVSGANFEKKVVWAVELENVINAELEKYTSEKHNVINQIQKVGNPVYAELLYKRYVKYEKFEKIAKDMNFEYSWIRHLHRKALEMFEKVMEEYEVR
ncbi:MAG: hypothetical protein MJ230_01720 [bacterium]|nr:hypothetical protein [bacterium]